LFVCLFVCWLACFVACLIDRLLVHLVVRIFVLSVFSSCFFLSFFPSFRLPLVALFSFFFRSVFPPVRRQNRERGHKMTRTVVSQALADIVEDKSKATKL